LSRDPDFLLYSSPMAKVSENDPTSIKLVHPVYLDTAMLVSFVAALEGGVSYGDEHTQRTASAVDRDKQGGGKIGVPLLSSLLSFDMSGRLAKKDHAEESEEIKVVRRHTEASIFNLLRHRLQADGQITVVTNDEQLKDLGPGDLIEITGELVGNPLQQILDLAKQILPYLGIDEEKLRNPKKATSASGSKRSGNPAVRSGQPTSPDNNVEETFKLMLLMQDDLEKASVRDVVLKTRETAQAVLTLSDEFFSAKTTDYVLGGEFTVLGKVTHVLDDQESINLTRRTALGLAGPEIAQDLVKTVTSISELLINIGDPIVEAPAIQVLPLAVFV
jgi:hypothetical protein